MLIRLMKILLIYIKAYIIKFLNIFIKIKKISIGSGRRNWIGWDMLDKDSFPLITYTEFNNFTKLPKKKYKIIFCSHFIEHIEDGAFINLINEIKKISDSESKILFKYPNFEFFYKAFHSNENDQLFLKITDGQYSPYTHTWKNFNVEDNKYNRISAMFCDYSNKNFGNPYSFSKDLAYSENAYHGPAQINQSRLKEIFNEKRFKNISMNLKAECSKDKELSSFNHMNSWNFEELKLIFINNGFKVISTNPDEIYEEFKFNIPQNEILFIKEWSNYIYLKI